jgi:hypothetical protein
MRSAQTISTGHALVQNIRPGHYELATDTHPRRRLATATELAHAIRSPGPAASRVSAPRNATDPAAPY